MPLTKKTDEFTVKEDTEKFLRRVKLKAHFHDKEQLSDEPQRDEFESLKPKKSKVSYALCRINLKTQL